MTVLDLIDRCRRLQSERFHAQMSLVDDPPVLIPAGALAEPEGAERRPSPRLPIATGSGCKASGSANAPTTERNAHG